ncbi:MAG: sulfotransferase, partial [Gammaproteobacteria bacterium]
MNAPSSSRPLILLFGMPRSGTTWLGKIFDSHPQTLYRHEPDSRGKLDALPQYAFARDITLYRDLLERFVAELPAVRDEKVAASLPIFPKQYYKPYQYYLRNFVVLAAKTVSRAWRSLPVPDVVDFAQHPQVSLVWKSIESMARLGLVSKVFPSARCLLILRHPCGYVNSVLRGEAANKFEGSAASSQDWNIYRMMLELPVASRSGLDLQAVRGMVEVERLALRWALSYEHAFTETTDAVNVARICYEDFCDDPVAQAKVAFEFCNLRFPVET